MKISKYFQPNPPKFTELNAFRFFTGILVGLAYSFLFYSLMYMTRESFRVLTVSKTYDIWVLSDEAVRFYNLFFAFISVIFGQSVCINFWIDTPGKFMETFNLRKTSIINEQRSLNNYFIYWFSQMSLAFVIIFGLIGVKGYYVVDAYKEYSSFFVLTVIVLFLYSWKSVILTFKRKSFKWIAGSAIIVSIISIALSYINFVDYKQINNYALGRRIDSKYNLEIPTSFSNSTIYDYKPTVDIHYVTSKYHNDITPILLVNNKVCNIDSLCKVIAPLKSELNENSFFSFIRYKCHIHKSIRMNYVIKLKKLLLECGVNRLTYDVIPYNAKYNPKYYEDCFFYQFNYIFSDTDYNSDEKPIIIKQNKKNELLIDNKIINNKDIPEVLYKGFENSCYYTLKVDKNLTFGNYLKIISAQKYVIDKQRNMYAKYKYMKEFERLNYIQAQEINDNCPLRIYEEYK